MVTTELHRPPPPPEDDPEAKPEPVPFTFRILDERRPMVYTPNVSFEGAIRFFRNFPKIGAYQVRAARLLACSRCCMEAGGQGCGVRMWRAFESHDVIGNLAPSS